MLHENLTSYNTLAMMFPALLLLLSLAHRVIGELHTSSRWILDDKDQRVKLRCTNWAGHMEVNIPEGLQHQPIDTIASWISDNGFNCVRLTYSIDMALNPSVSVSDSFNTAASAAGVPPSALQALYTQASKHNPLLTTASRLDVFAAVIDSLHRRGVYTILDNHVSRASWCCNFTDGNGWWDKAQGYNDLNSRYFDTDAWHRGLEAMARFASSQAGVVGMSLRNELRAVPLIQDLNVHADWYDQLTRAAQKVHDTNPSVLIIIGGVYGGTDLSFLRIKTLDAGDWAQKLVWEFHAYAFSLTQPNPGRHCNVASAEYGASNGFLLTQEKDYTGPLFLSEFGVAMTGGGEETSGLSEDDLGYLKCLVEYMESNDAEWAVWALQGSYYVRDGQVDMDESFGLLTKDWSRWRNPRFRGLLGGMWDVTQGPGKE